MAEPPRGTVAFLFTDIEGSTRLWQRDRPAMARASARHDAILRAAVADQGGVVYKVIGDAVQAAFPTAPDALAAAVEAQLGLEFEDWAGLGLPEPLKVRTALHAGDVDPAPDGDYRSPVLNRLGRLLGAGHGGQVLLSQAVVQLARDRLPDETALRDLGEHRLKDLLEPESIHQLLHPALPDAFPPLATLERRPHNLPVQLTPLLGRERELADVVDLLRREDVRLATLTGPGGTGKTRLSLQVGAELVDDFPDGVWFVPLAAVTEPALVPSAVAEALGVRESGGPTLPELLRAFLRGRRLLLVLDNFEQVLDAAPAVQDLLAAPGVTVLVTSRSPLRLKGEREYPVASLGLPRRRPPPTVEQVGQSSAVRLFVDRAQAARPGFVVDAANAPVIAEICHRLDGLPLAIELAAARVKLLPPAAMLARLEQRLPLLTGGARDLPERQQTLRAAIAWGYDLLQPDERRLHRRLSVFADGWTLDAAEAVAGSSGSGEPGLDVLDGLGRLVDHSLIRQEEAEGEPRFAMLGTIREYGLEQLEASGEADEARDRHAAFFLALAERAEPQLTGHGQAEWLSRLETELDNYRAALAWTMPTDPETALRLVAVPWRLWYLRGHLSEGRSWLARGLASPLPVSAPVRARALDAASGLVWAQGDLAPARALAEESVALYRKLGDEWGLASALNGLGAVLNDLMLTERGAAVLEEELALRRRLGDARGTGIAVYNLAEIAKVRGMWARAAAGYAEAITLLRAAGDTANVGAALTSGGIVAVELGAVERALALIGDGLALARAIADRRNGAFAFEAVARVAGEMGHPDDTARLLGAAEGIRDEIGAPLPPLERSWFDPMVARTRAALGSEGYAAATAAGATLSFEQAIEEAMAVVGRLRTRRGGA